MRITQPTPTLLKLQNRRYLNWRFGIIPIGLLPLLIAIGTARLVNAQDDRLDIRLLVFFAGLIGVLVVFYSLLKKEVSRYLFDKKANRLYLTTNNVFTSKDTSYSLDEVEEVAVFEELGSNGTLCCKTLLILKTGQTFCLRESHRAQSHYKLAATINSFLGE